MTNAFVIFCNDPLWTLSLMLAGFGTPAFMTSRKKEIGIEFCGNGKWHGNLADEVLPRETLHCIASPLAVTVHYPHRLQLNQNLLFLLKSDSDGFLASNGTRFFLCDNLSDVFRLVS